MNFKKHERTTILNKIIYLKVLIKETYIHFEKQVCEYKVNSYNVLQS